MRCLMPVIVALSTGCYAPDPPAGIECDLADPVCPDGQSCVATPAGVACRSPGVPACSPDDAVCLSFDANPLPDILFNEGAVPTTAVVQNGSRIDEGSGGAVLLGSETQIAVPQDPPITGVTRIDVRFRLDQEIPVDERVGLVDADATSMGFSMFLGRVGQSYSLRCSIDGPVLAAALEADPRGRWLDSTCECAAGKLRVVVDAVVAATAAASCGPARTETGFQIGQNSRGADKLPPNEPFVGAIDFVRLVTK